MRPITSDMGYVAERQHCGGSRVSDMLRVRADVVNFSAMYTKSLDFTIKDFFVFIIESNKAGEIIAGLSEGAALRKVFEFSGITVEYYTAFDANTFAVQIARMFSRAQRTHEFPILHIASHGSSQGIHLTVGDVISWQQLVSMLDPLRQISNYLLCLSACEGLTAEHAVIKTPKLPPFGIVGTPEKVAWSDTVVAFTAFYHLLQKQKTIQEAVAGMKAASGHDTYSFVHGAL